MSVVVDTDAVIDPWTVTVVKQHLISPRRQGRKGRNGETEGGRRVKNVLIMLGDTTTAPPTVFAPKRRTNHAGDTKVGLVELPEADKLVDDGFLLGNTVQLGHKAWVVHH